MTKNEIAYLILRIFALYIVIISLNPFMSQSLSFMFMVAQQQSKVSSNYFMIIPFIVYIIPVAFGVYLWICAKKLAPMFVLESNSSNINENDYSLNILKLALVIMGLFIIAHAVPYIFQAFITLSLVSNDVKDIDPRYYNGFKQTLALHGSLFAIGFSMIVGNQFYLRALRYGRNMWMNKK